MNKSESKEGNNQRDGHRIEVPINQSPMRLHHLLNIFVRPRKFYSSLKTFYDKPYFIFVTYCFGIAYAIDRIDREIIRAELGNPRNGWTKIAPYVTESWLGYWAFVFLYGALAASMLWLVGGWWYRIRLRWAGAINPDVRLARKTYLFSSFVWSAPVILVTLLYTVIFQNYEMAYESDNISILIFIAVPFWSCIVSYRGVTTLFEVKRVLAFIWFLVLPWLYYIWLFIIVSFYYPWYAQ